MDVLRPTLIRIGGRVYRKNLIQEQARQHEEEEEDFCAGTERCARGGPGAVRRCYGWKHRHRRVLVAALVSLGAEGPACVVGWEVPEGEERFALVPDDLGNQSVDIMPVTPCGFGCLCC